ncbi:MAG: methyltransferase domain-containing protein [Nocardioidaceae bacterium]
MPSWDPTTYLQFSDERSRPFFDLTAKIDVRSPNLVIDLGCGPGHLTAALARRWPTAEVVGIDSSAEMIESARGHRAERLTFEPGDIADWRPDVPVDVIVANAALQWVPGHRSMLPRLVDALAPGGWLAFQVPGNFMAPSHVLLRELADDPRFDVLAKVQRPAAFDAAIYLADLLALGCRVDAWETTCLHVLTGADPVYRWISGTGARPVLQALAPDQRETFESEYKRGLRCAYPPQEFGTVLPFRRVFVVAQKLGVDS